MVVAAAMTACASATRVPEGLPPDSLFQRALNQFHERNWTDAITLFERFVIEHPTHPRVQEARLFIGHGYFGRKEYITAATEYSRLANDYPAGPYGDDARFKVCESYYKLSPKPPLDQQYTRAAIDHCQSLLTYYPSSEFAAPAQEMLTELRNKLASKVFLTAEFYFKRAAYDSGIIYYDQAVRDYSDTPFAPRALLRLFETYQILGYKEEADAAKQRLLKDYPTSPEARQLQEPAPPSGS
ncbi:MAG: outer membrane protein assembly factor BamD [Gemmatimonadota bacterium]